MTTPVWQAPQNGFPGDQDAALGSAHLNQLLGAHGVNAIYYGNQIVASTGQNNFAWHTTGSSEDIAQKFTMSGTTIGRVTVPVQSTGNGCDLLVTLCADSAGAPNTTAPIAQTRLTAAAIAQLAAPTGLATGPVLASPLFNTTQGYGGVYANPWTSPAASVNGVPSLFAVTTGGNYGVLLGGYDATAATAVSIVTTVQYLGGGSAGLPVQQPPLPVATFYGSAAIAGGAIMYAGGQTGSGGPTSKVWVAGWDQSTGTVAAWSAQTALPTTINQATAAAWNNTVYVIGGTPTNSSTNAVSTVYMNTANNGQLGSWQTTTPLPQPLTFANAGVVGNWLIVAGGLNASSVIQGTTYYAPILANGSLGVWQTGPTIPVPTYALTPQWACTVTDSAFILWAGNIAGPTDIGNIQILPVDTAGVAPAWSNSVTAGSFTFNLPCSAFSDGNGNWSLIGYNTNNLYYGQQLLSVPTLSVPLAATGLTNGSPYWIVMQAFQAENATDTLQIGLNSASFPADAVKSARHVNSWSTLTAGSSVPINVYDTTPSGTLIHLLEDQVTSVGAIAPWQRWTTLIPGVNKLLQGAVEIGLQPNNPLNSNSTFASGVSPWTATNGTITQSAAQTHGGFAFSGLLTPSGGFSTASAKSELIPITQTPYGSAQWALPVAWLYSPTGWANTSLSVNWYDSSQTLISTSSNVINLAATTWTQFTNWFQAPATAAYAQLAPTESGTPGATNLLYISNPQLLLSEETVPALTSAATVNYPAGAYWPPTGVTQLN